MALTQGSIINISEINAEFDTKIDTAGAGLSKDGTSLALASLHSASGSAGPSANATPAYGATFTVPQINYDTYGRVTGHSNRTVQIPAAPSVTNISGTAAKATATPNVVIANANAVSFILPSGGTWKYWWVNGYDASNTHNVGSASGGSTVKVTPSSYSGTWKFDYIAIRTA